MYRRLRSEHYTTGQHADRLVDRLASGNAISDDDVFNVFEAVLWETMPLAAALIEECSEGARPCAHLAGSGPAFFFLSPPADDVRQRLLRAGVTS